jgi:hypothetical protein
MKFRPKLFVWHLIFWPKIKNLIVQKDDKIEEENEIHKMWVNCFFLKKITHSWAFWGCFNTISWLHFNSNVIKPNIIGWACKISAIGVFDFVLKTSMIESWITSQSTLSFPCSWLSDTSVSSVFDITWKILRKIFMISSMIKNGIDISYIINYIISFSERNSISKTLTISTARVRIPLMLSKWLS